MNTQQAPVRINFAKHFASKSENRKKEKFGGRFFTVADNNTSMSFYEFAYNTAFFRAARSENDFIFIITDIANILGISEELFTRTRYGRILTVELQELNGQAKYQCADLGKLTATVAAAYYARSGVSKTSDDFMRFIVSTFIPFYDDFVREIDGHCEEEFLTCIEHAISKHVELLNKALTKWGEQHEKILTNSLGFRRFPEGIAKAIDALNKHKALL